MTRIGYMGFGALFLTACAVAQPYGSDLLVTAIPSSLSGPGLLYRLGPRGAVTTLLGSGLGTANMVAVDATNQTVVVPDAVQLGALRVVDPQISAVVGTLWAGAPLVSVQYLAPTHRGDWVIVSYAGASHGLFLLRRDGSSISTLHAGAPFSFGQSVLQDLVTGNYVVGDFHNQALYEYSISTGRLVTLVPAGLSNGAMVQDHRDGALIIGGTGGRVFAFDRNSGVTTILAGSPSGSNAIAFDRWSGNGEIVVGSGPVHRITRGGQLVASHPTPAQFINTGMCFDAGRNVVPLHVSFPNRWRFQLHFPVEVGRFFILGVSAAGFKPGIAVGGRIVPLALDGVLVQSVSGGLAPFLTGNLGTLNVFGRAQADLDLSAFGASLRGVRLWVAALTLDAAAPGGVATISKPNVLVLE